MHLKNSYIKINKLKKKTKQILSIRNRVIYINKIQREGGL